MNKYLHLLFVLFLPVLISCSKKPVVYPSKDNKSDTTKVDTTKTDTSKVVGLPPNTYTTFGINSTSWIMSMHNAATNSIVTTNGRSNIVADAVGNVYVLFNYYGVLDIDPGIGVFVAGSYVERATLAKYSVDGKLLWAKQFYNYGTANARKLVIDKQGNVYCALSCNQAAFLKFDNYTYTFKSKRTAGIILKFTDSGNMVWLKEVGNEEPITNFELWDLVTDSDGNVYFTGAFNGPSVIFYDGAKHYISNPSTDDPFNIQYFWAKYDTNGNYLLSKIILPAERTTDSYTFLGTKPALILVDIDNNVIICGSAFYSTKINTKQLGNSLDWGGEFITKYDKNGNWLWVKGYTGNIYSTGGQKTPLYSSKSFSAMLTDSKGSIYVLGNDREDGLGDLIWKIDNNGNEVWHQNINTSLVKSTTSMAWDNNEQILVVGDYVINPKSSYTSETSNHAIYLNKYTSNGALVNTKNLSGYTNLTYVSNYNATIDRAGNINLIGFFNGSIKLLDNSGDPINKKGDYSASLFIAHFPDKP